MNAQLKLKEEVEWRTEESGETIQVIETNRHTWRERLVSIWEGVWFAIFAAQVVRFNNETERYEQETNLKHQVAEALMRTRIF